MEDYGPYTPSRPVLFLTMSQSKDFAMLDAILKSGALISGESDTKESPGGEVLSFSRTEWAGISESKRRDIFSKHHIRVTGNGPSFDVMSDVKSWDDSDALAKYTSLLELRQAHGESTNSFTRALLTSHYRFLHLCTGNQSAKAHGQDNSGESARAGAER